MENLASVDAALDLVTKAYVDSRTTTKTSEWNWRSAQQTGDPGSGGVGVDSAAPIDATKVYLSFTNSAGQDLGFVLKALRSGDGLLITRANDATIRLRYDITAAPTVQATWIEIPVAAVVAASAGTEPGNNSDVLVTTEMSGGGGGGGLDQATADTRYVNVTGDTMTGDLLVDDGTGLLNVGRDLFSDGYGVTLDGTSKPLTLTQLANGEIWLTSGLVKLFTNMLISGGWLRVDDSEIRLNTSGVAVRPVSFTTGDTLRWQVGVTEDPETGGNAGSAFVLSRFDDAGNFIDNVFAVFRGNGSMIINHDMNMNGNWVFNLHDPESPQDAATKGYVDTRTPRITSSTTAPSGPAVGDIWVDTN